MWGNMYTERGQSLIIGRTFEIEFLPKFWEIQAKPPCTIDNNNDVNKQSLCVTCAGHCRRNSGGSDIARRNAPCVWFPKNQRVRQINIPANNCRRIWVPPTNVRRNFGHDGGDKWNSHGGVNGRCIFTSHQVAKASLTCVTGVPPSCHWLQHLLVFPPFVCPCLRPPHHSLHVPVPDRQVDGENGTLFSCLFPSLFYLLLFTFSWFFPWFWWFTFLTVFLCETTISSFTWWRCFII